MGITAFRWINFVLNVAWVSLCFYYYDWTIFWIIFLALFANNTDSEIKKMKHDKRQLKQSIEHHARKNFYKNFGFACDSEIIVELDDGEEKVFASANGTKYYCNLEKYKLPKSGWAIVV